MPYMVQRILFLGRDIYTGKKKIQHPYRKIHPWRSEKEFAKDLVKNIIYNADGIVVINKPYGISSNTLKHAKNHAAIQCHKIVGAVDYTIEKVLPDIARELDISNLIPCIGAEKYMSGVYILATNSDIAKQVDNARKRATAFKKFRKYWGITIKHPNEIKGSYHLGMKLEQHSKVKYPIFVTKWSKNEEKRGNVRIMNVNYKLLSNSTHNLSSLVQIESSAKKWHCIRLFASIMIYSPILGDNQYGSRVQKIMNTWMKVNPLSESCLNMPKIDRQLLELLKLTPQQQEIIPLHLHLRSIYLDGFGKEKKNLVLEAPLPEYFNWTCQQLMFKNIPCKKDYTSTEDEIKISSM